MTCWRRPGASNLGWRGILFFRQDLLDFEDFFVCIFNFLTKLKIPNRFPKRAIFSYRGPETIEVNKRDAGRKLRKHQKTN